MRTSSQTIRSLRDENKRLEDETHRLRAELHHLHRAIQALNTLQYQIDAITPDTDALVLIHNLLSAALDAVGSENGSLLLLDEESDELVFVNVIGLSREALTGYRMPSDEGIAGWIINERSPALVSEARKDPRWSAQVDEAVGFRTASLIGVPLLDGDRPLGVIEVLNPFSGESFREDDLDIMILVSRLVSLCILRAEQVGEM